MAEKIPACTRSGTPMGPRRRIFALIGPFHTQGVQHEQLQELAAHRPVRRRGADLMELLFLGTSSGTPTRARNVSGLGLLEDSGKGWYLIDCGEGTQHQVLRTPLSLSALRAIFITHVHGDHCFGLPGLLASAALQGRTAPLEIVAPHGIEAWLNGTLAMSETFLPYQLVFHAVESLDEWRTPQMRVRAIALSHRCASFAYRFEEARPDTTLNIPRLEREAIPRGPLWGQLARGFDVTLEGRLLRSEDYLL